MGWTPQTFWDSTPFEFFNILEGFIDYQDQLQRNAWRQTQLLAFYQVITAPHYTQGSLKGPEDLIKTKWDDENTGNNLKSPDQLIDSLSGVK